MGKTPYEIRLDVLAMAKDMLEKESIQNVKATGSTNALYPKTEEIVSKANELYSFVNDTSVGATRESKYSSGSSGRKLLTEDKD